MITSLLDLQQPVEDALSILKPELKLEGFEWQVLSEIQSILAPFEEVTKDISSQYYPSVSKVIPCVRELCKELELLECLYVDCMLLKDALQDNLQSRFGNIESVTPLLVSTYLDPR